MFHNSETAVIFKTINSLQYRCCNVTFTIKNISVNRMWVNQLCWKYDQEKPQKLYHMIISRNLTNLCLFFSAHCKYHFYICNTCTCQWASMCCVYMLYFPSTLIWNSLNISRMHFAFDVLALILFQNLILNLLKLLVN